MNRRAFPWSRLGIDPTSDTGAIRKAYADVLRAINPDEDIAGFAELRRARDQALWLAAQGQRDEAEGNDLGLGGWDDDDDGDDWADDGGAWDIAPGIQQPLSAPSAPAPSEAQIRAQAAWNRLLDVLYPDGDPSDEAVTHRELDDGLAALHTLIARAEEADLEEHDALDSALADLFARTWPRSAPFVEPANAAFHWLDEAGALEERPALRFLNDRLKGMRFHEKVQQPGHPLHKAWAELSRPGRAGVLDRLRVKRLEVDKLLTGIRQRYPELESHLDSERIASWDKNGALDGASGGLTPGVARVLLILVLVGLALARVGANIAWDDSDDGTGPSKEEVNSALIDAQLNIAAPEVFGPGTDLAALRKADPVFVEQWRLAVGQGSNVDAALAFVRFRAAASGEVAEYDQLVMRADLRGMWMRAALTQSQEVCRNIMGGDFSSIPLKLDEKQRAREQTLLKQLLDSKVLSHVPQGKATRYSIPGWLVEDAIKRSELTEKRLAVAWADPESPDRCAAELALIEAARASSRRVPKDVLKGL